MVPSSATATNDRPPNRDRGLLGIVRALVTLSIVALLAASVVLFAPGAVDEVLDVRTPIDAEAPPPAGERTPEVRHAQDPANSTYDADTRIRSAHVEDYIHHEVNEIRTDRGLEPLEWDAQIASVSRAHSADMAAREYFAHENPDGQSPLDRFQTTGDYCRRYGENIAQSWVDRPVQLDDGDVATYETAEAAAEGLVEQWMNSPPHREAILSSNWDRAGVGVYLDDSGKIYATQNFCTEW